MLLQEAVLTPRACCDCTEAPPELQNVGGFEAQNRRGKTHLSMTKNGAHSPTVVCLSATVIA